MYFIGFARLFDCCCCCCYRFQNVVRFVYHFSLTASDISGRLFSKCVFFHLRLFFRTYFRFYCLFKLISDQSVGIFFSPFPNKLYEFRTFAFNFNVIGSRNEFVFQQINIDWPKWLNARNFLYRKYIYSNRSSSFLSSLSTMLSLWSSQSMCPFLFCAFFASAYCSRLETWIPINDIYLNRKCRRFDSTTER